LDASQQKGASQQQQQQQKQYKSGATKKNNDADDDDEIDEVEVDTELSNEFNCNLSLNNNKNTNTASLSLADEEDVANVNDVSENVEDNNDDDNNNNNMNNHNNHKNNNNHDDDEDKNNDDEDDDDDDDDDLSRINNRERTQQKAEEYEQSQQQLQQQQIDQQRLAVLSFEQVNKLNEVMNEHVSIHGRGNFPTLEVRLKDFVTLVREKLELDIQKGGAGMCVKDIRLNGGAASHVLAYEAQSYNDLDLIFAVEFSSNRHFDRVKSAVLSTLSDLLPDGTMRKRITPGSLREAYVGKMVKVSDALAAVKFS
jgi:Nucleotidyltransferase